VAYTEDKAFELIQNAHERDRLGHAFLVIGSEESGTHRLAARMIDLVNQTQEEDQGFDLFGEAPTPSSDQPKVLAEYEGEHVRIIRPQSKSRRIRTDEIRTLEKAIYKSAPEGIWNIGVIVDADRLMIEAENAFLKTLEEPPPNTLLILITTNPEGLLPTILSRCVNMNLIDPDQKQLSESETHLIQSLSQFAKSGFGDVATALSLKSQFHQILTTRKNKIAKTNEIALKEEEQMYSKTTEGDWLKRREEYYKALTESEYLEDRSKLINVMVQWIGDIIRIKCGHDEIDYPYLKKASSLLADAEELSSLLQRIEAINNLRTCLETNAQEQIALEVGFLRAFA